MSFHHILLLYANAASWHMLWSDIRFGVEDLKARLTHFSYSVFGSRCGFKHRRLTTWRLFLNCLSSSPDLYVISVLSDNLSHHAFPARGRGLSRMTWRGPRPRRRAGVSGRWRCVRRGCGGESRWRGVIVTVYIGWVMLWVVSLLGLSRSAQWWVSVQEEPKEPIRCCSSVMYWRWSSPSAWFNGAILLVSQPLINTLEGYQFFLDALTLNVAPGFDSVWSICHHLTTGGKKESTERPMWL